MRPFSLFAPSRSAWTVKIIALGAGVWLLSLPHFDSNDWIPTASASLYQTDDEDGDLLLDSLEDWLGTSSLNPDFDGDGVIDGVEYILGTDMKDPLSVPVIAPGYKMGVFVDDGEILVTLYFFPGDETVLGDFVFYAISSDQSSQFEFGLDLSPFLSSSVTEYNSTSFNGFCATSFSLRIPISIVEDLGGTVCLASAANIAGVPIADISMLTIVDGVPLVMRVEEPALGNARMAQSDWDSLTDSTPPGWGAEEVCETSYAPAGGVGAFVIYEITAASCENQTNRFCPTSSCTARLGSTFVSFDYGFLMSSVAD